VVSHSKSLSFASSTRRTQVPTQQASEWPTPPRGEHLNMPTVRDLRCTINTPGGAMIEYLPPPEDPLDPTTPYHPDTPNTHTRYVSITGCENERLYIKLNGTSEFRWSEGLCTKITADFYIDGVLVGSRPYYEHFENGRSYPQLLILSM